MLPMTGMHCEIGEHCGRFEPPLDHWPDAGVYQVGVRATRTVTIRVGRLGLFRFPAGRYVYTGRAFRALPARIRRHVHGGRRLHWHIDYLLAGPGVHVERVELASTDPEAECSVNQALAEHSECVVPGFGSSDCSNGCGTHLWRMLPAVDRVDAAGPLGGVP